MPEIEQATAAPGEKRETLKPLPPAREWCPICGVNLAYPANRRLHMEWHEA